MEERKYLYWCVKTGKKCDPVFILEHITDMTSHTNTIVNGCIGGDVPTLNREDIKYVYNSCMSDDRITALLCDSKYYYVIDNSKTGEDEVSSRLWYHHDVVELLNLVPNSVLKVMDIKLGKKMSLQQENALSKVQPFDFARASHDEQVKLWKQLITERDESLDLSGLTFLNPRVIIEAGVKPTHRTLIINQNLNLCSSINWIFYFSNLNTLTIWNSDIKDEALNGIAKFGYGLITLEFHACPNISGRIIPHVMKLPILENLIIDNTTAIFHPEKSLLCSCLTDEEWDTVQPNTSIRQIVINSANLTRDFIKPFIARLKGLEHFVMHDIVMRQLEKNSASGYEEQKIVFHSQDNLQTGFSRQANVKIYGLVRDKCGPMFSQSMLNKIKELDPSKAEAVELLK